MAKSQLILERGIETTAIDGSSIHSPNQAIKVPQTYLTIMCPCGKEHKIDLSNLPQSTSRRIQVHEKCKYAQHFIIHTGHAKYRKILIVSDYGEE
jgi:hypothetical protein